MRITRVEDFQVDGGWRTLAYLKVETDAGITGWSEFGAGPSVPGLAAVVRALAARCLGEDPGQAPLWLARLRAATRMAGGGLVHQALAAIDNACLEIRARSQGLAVHQWLGGARRRRLPVYWSQCGTLRTRHAACLDVPALRSLDDVVALGGEVRERGFQALKTNILTFHDGQADNYRPGFGVGEAFPSLALADRTLAALRDLMAAFRQGAGSGVRLMLDLNFNVTLDGACRIARALEPLDLLWLEIDSEDPGDLAALRRASGLPVASLESVFGCREMRPFLAAGAVDVAIIDPQWNGLPESLRMAELAAADGLAVAAHNYHGPLSTLMGAHFSAVVANPRLTELVVDQPPWLPGLLSPPLRVEDGELLLPEGPGWGAEVDEQALRAHAARVP